MKLQLSIEVKDLSHIAPPEADDKSEGLVKLTMFNEITASELETFVKTVLLRNELLVMEDEEEYSMNAPPCRAVLPSATIFARNTDDAKTNAPPPNNALQLRNDVRFIVTLNPGLKTAMQPPDVSGGGCPA